MEKCIYCNGTGRELVEVDNMYGLEQVYETDCAMCREEALFNLKVGDIVTYFSVGALVHRVGVVKWVTEDVAFTETVISNGQYVSGGTAYICAEDTIYNVR